MKKVRICFEVKNGGTDENGNIVPCGMEFSIGEVTDEKYASIDYFEAMKGVSAIDCLKAMGMEDVESEFKEQDFRIISPEEYDREYGDEDVE